MSNLSMIKFIVPRHQCVAYQMIMSSIGIEKLGQRIITYWFGGNNISINIPRFLFCRGNDCWTSNSQEYHV